MEVQKDLGVSHAVFFRSLAQLPEGWVSETRSTGATLEYGGGTVTIELAPECERRIGLIRIPHTPTVFRFEGLSDVEREAFQSRFDLTFQRGGG
jgi:hypothetical protein